MLRSINLQKGVHLMKNKKTIKSIGIFIITLMMASVFLSCSSSDETGLTDDLDSDVSESTIDVDYDTHSSILTSIAGQESSVFNDSHSNLDLSTVATDSSIASAITNSQSFFIARSDIDTSKLLSTDPLSKATALSTKRPQKTAFKNLISKNLFHFSQPNVETGSKQLSKKSPMLNPRKYSFSKTQDSVANSDHLINTIKQLNASQAKQYSNQIRPKTITPFSFQESKSPKQQNLPTKSDITLVPEAYGDSFTFDGHVYDFDSSEPMVGAPEAFFEEIIGYDIDLNELYVATYFSANDETEYVISIYFYPETNEVGPIFINNAFNFDGLDIYDSSFSFSHSLSASEFFTIYQNYADQLTVTYNGAEFYYYTSALVENSTLSDFLSLDYDIDSELTSFSYILYIDNTEYDLDNSNDDLFIIFDSETNELLYYIHFSYENDTVDIVIETTDNVILYESEYDEYYNETDDSNSFSFNGLTYYLYDTIVVDDSDNISLADYFGLELNIINDLYNYTIVYYIDNDQNDYFGSVFDAIQVFDNETGELLYIITIDFQTNHTILYDSFSEVLYDSTELDDSELTNENDSDSFSFNGLTYYFYNTIVVDDSYNTSLADYFGLELSIINDLYNYTIVYYIDNDQNDYGGSLFDAIQVLDNETGELLYIVTIDFQTNQTILYDNTETIIYDSNDSSEITTSSEIPYVITYNDVEYIGSTYGVIYGDYSIAELFSTDYITTELNNVDEFYYFIYESTDNNIYVAIYDLSENQLYYILNNTNIGSVEIYTSSDTLLLSLIPADDTIVLTVNDIVSSGSYEVIAYTEYTVTLDGTTLDTDFSYTHYFPSSTNWDAMIATDLSMTTSYDSNNICIDESCYDSIDDISLDDVIYPGSLLIDYSDTIYTYLFESGASAGDYLLFLEDGTSPIAELNTTNDIFEIYMYNGSSFEDISL